MLFGRKKQVMPEPESDPTAWMLDNPFSEFVLLNNIEIKFMCMLGYAFFTGTRRSANENL